MDLRDCIGFVEISLEYSRMKFEIWQSEVSHECLKVPSTGRITMLHERKSKLLLRFEASGPKKAQQIYERFAFGGNPDGLIPLNEPAKKFFLPTYPCGLAAGDRVIFRKKYYVRIDGCVCREYPKGLRAKVLKGDVDMPETVWLWISKQDPCHSITCISQEDACEFLEREKSTSKK